MFPCLVSIFTFLSLSSLSQTLPFDTNRAARTPQFLEDQLSLALKIERHDASRQSNPSSPAPSEPSSPVTATPVSPQPLSSSPDSEESRPVAAPAPPPPAPPPLPSPHSHPRRAPAPTHPAAASGFVAAAPGGVPSPAGPAQSQGSGAMAKPLTLGQQAAPDPVAPSPPTPLFPLPPQPTPLPASARLPGGAAAAARRSLWRSLLCRVSGAHPSDREKENAWSRTENAW